MIYHSLNKTAHTKKKKSKKELQTSTVKYIPKFFPQAKSPKSQAQAFSPNQSTNVDKWELHQNPGVWQ